MGRRRLSCGESSPALVCPQASPSLQVSCVVGPTVKISVKSLWQLETQPAFRL